MNGMIANRARVGAAALAVALLAALAPARTVTLAEAWELIRQGSPALAAARAGVRAAEAELTQARLLQNPELEVMTEDYGRSEVELGLTLPVEIGGRRRARVRAARAALDIARIDEIKATQGQRAETIRRFAAALALRLELEFSDTLQELVRASAGDLARRVEAGAAAELDLLRERTELKSLGVEARGLELGFRAACRALAALAGGAPGTEWEPTGSFIGLPELPEPGAVRASILGCPDVLCCNREVEAARAELAGARAEGFPALALTGAYKINNEAGERAVLLGVSMSLPIFDRNQGASRAAEHAVTQAEQAAMLERTGREVGADELLAELAGLSQSIETGYADILPAHRRVLNTLTRHYEQGAVGILELIEAQREYHETALELLEAQRERAELAADLLETTGFEITVIKE